MVLFLDNIELDIFIFTLLNRNDFIIQLWKNKTSFD